LNKTLKNALSYAAMLGATAFLLWFSLKNIEAPEGQSKFDFIKGTWDKANKFLILLSGALAVLAHLVRAERWRLMLKPIGYSTSIISSFFSVMVGYFINLAIPRGGEVSRCLNMFRLEKVPVETSAGTVVAERLIDVVFLLGFIGTTFLIEYDKLLELLKGFIEKRNQAQAINGSGFPLLWIVLVAVVLGTLLLVFLSKNGKLKPIIEKVIGIWINLRKGLFSVFTLEKKGLFLFYSLLIWVLYFMMAWLVMLAFDETRVLGLDAALTVFTLGSIAMAMPLPGGAGSYHILVPAGLNLFYGLALENALAFTVVFHAWQTLVLIIFGFIAMIGSQFYKQKA
jgi:uncharacterized protein (TIRG00374 family)